MLNKEHFELLAGNPDRWDQEILEAKDQSGFNLTQIQEDQHARGRRSAILVHAFRGWQVRYDSNLDDRALLFGTPVEGLLSRGEAIEKGIQWANDDPDNREFYARKTDLEVS